MSAGRPIVAEKVLPQLLRTGDIQHCQWPECGHVATLEVVDEARKVQGRYCLEHGTESALRLKSE
jgi:hypothetical protein